jgi:hypothetical protein
VSANPGPSRSASPDGLLGRRSVSVARATLHCMEVTENDIKRIPVRNLRVPRDEFVAVWSAVEQLSTDQAQQRVIDWYTGGVLVTCQWMARAVVRPASDGPWRLARPPVSRHDERAYEELIEAEYLAAELLDVRRPDLFESRPGWCEGIQATLRWAWRHAGPPPIDVPVRAAG